MSSFLPGLGVALDLLWGDPSGVPHPVRGIGRAAGLLESWARVDGRHLRFKGALCVFILAALSWSAVSLLDAIPYVGWACAIYFTYAGLALGCLLRDGRAVARLLDETRLIEARRQLGLMVSRDTSQLGPDALRRALAETLSENLGDGLVAPLFFLGIGGPAGLWAYKAVSTLDSMWGYRNERYVEFGWAAARADDVLAYIPARLTWLCLVVAGGCLGLDWLAALRHTPGDARKYDSPNAGWPMAAAAWLCGAWVGGPIPYPDGVKNKPALGPDGAWSSARIQTLLRLVFWAGIVAAVVAQLVALD